ncbi:MAG: HypC/HybG/HupF family hydrogenase formation chaperone [Anaerolineae bacterium]|nr:HypC/HybG/HupF family hydrogenase formation chaperone [Anaerolineae bacterium]
MCLGVPGKIISIYEANGLTMAKIDFGGVSREACIQTLPEAKIGDYTIVHAGFGLNILSEEEAMDTLNALEELSLVEQELGNDEEG